MSYLIQGYVFISVFLFITKGNSNARSTITVLSSIALSYILKLSYDKTIIALLSIWFTINIDSEWYYIGLLLFSVILAYVLGMICVSNKVAELLEKLRIPFTFNKDFWTDIYLKNDWFHIHLKGQDKYYLGKIDYLEENVSNPHIALIDYSVFTKDGKEINMEREENIQSSLIIQLNDIEYIEALKYSPKKENKNQEGTK